MAPRYHRAQKFRREHAYVLFFLPACTLVTCVSLVLKRISCTRTHACLYSALVRYSRGISFACKFEKTRVHGCAHAIRAILNAGTVLASIKFKSSCTVVALAVKVKVVVVLDVHAGKLEGAIASKLCRCNYNKTC